VQRGAGAPRELGDAPLDRHVDVLVIGCERERPLAQLDLDAVFDYDAYLTHLPEIFDRLEAIRS